MSQIQKEISDIKETKELIHKLENIVLEHSKNNRMCSDIIREQLQSIQRQIINLIDQ